MLGSKSLVRTWLTSLPVLAKLSAVIDSSPPAIAALPSSPSTGTRADAHACPPASATTVLPSSSCPASSQSSYFIKNVDPVRTRPYVFADRLRSI